MSGFRPGRHEIGRKKKGPILNLELWKEADDLVSRHECHWKWVRGHEGHPQNEYANFLATRAAAEQSNSGGLRQSEFDSWLKTHQAGPIRLKDTAPFPDLQSFQPSKRAWTT
jgi:ribonuclease HI